MDNLVDLQKDLQEVQARIERDEQAGLGWANEDIHLAGELMARIDKIRAVSEGSG